jgi:hypothetical protein
MALQGAIRVDDYDKLLKDLKAISPELRKDFTKALNRAVLPARDAARSFVPNDNPLRNWRQKEPTYTSLSWANDFEHRGRDAAYRWKWVPSLVRKGIKISRTRFATGRELGAKIETTAISLINSEAPGIIYELTGAGTRKSIRKTKRVSRNPDAEQDFKRSMARERGRPKRLVYRAAETHGAKVIKEVEHVLETRLLKFVRGVR